MCWVIPPASPATTFEERIRSSRSVLPWSTWPMMVTTGGRGRRSSSSLFLDVFEVLGLELGLLLLAGIDQADLGADLGREQLDHVVAQRLGGRHHLALEEEEADDVAGRPVELRARARVAVLPRSMMTSKSGTGRIRRRVGGGLGRLELLEVATPTARAPLRGPAAAAGPAAQSRGRRSAARPTAAEATAAAGSAAGAPAETATGSARRAARASVAAGRRASTGAGGSTGATGSRRSAPTRGRRDGPPGVGTGGPGGAGSDLPEALTGADRAAAVGGRRRGLAGPGRARPVVGAGARAAGALAAGVGTGSGAGAAAPAAARPGASPPVPAGSGAGRVDGPRGGGAAGR